MRPQPFDPAEVGSEDHSLDAVTMALQRYAANTDAPHDAQLTDRIRAAIADEPLPRRGWLTAPGGGLGSGYWTRALALAGVVAATIVTAVAVGGLLDLARTIEPGATPPPLVSPSMAPTPTASPAASASPSPDGSASASPSVSAGAAQSHSPEDSPSPSESDGGGNSGPGGGDGDSGSGSSGSGSSGSGSEGGSGSDDGD
jgi:uncharacterized membrane protein YgcG